MPIHQPIPPKTLNLQNLGETNTPPPHVPRVITPPIPSNATKIGNPTSQCALIRIVRTFTLYILRPNSDQIVTKKKSYQPVCSSNFKPIRAHWLVGFPILMAFGCTFIHGGVHTRMHMYWGGASTTGGVPS